MADAAGLNPAAARHVGSNPAPGTSSFIAAPPVGQDPHRGP